MCPCATILIVFFFNETAPTEPSPLPPHAPLPFCATSRLRGKPPVCREPYGGEEGDCPGQRGGRTGRHFFWWGGRRLSRRSEEHTSELQSRQYLVCRLLLEKKTEYNTAEVLYCR